MHLLVLSSMLNVWLRDIQFSEACSFLPERGVFLVAAKWYFPALNALLIVRKTSFYPSTFHCGAETRVVLFVAHFLVQPSLRLSCLHWR